MGGTESTPGGHKRRGSKKIPLAELKRIVDFLEARKSQLQKRVASLKQGNSWQNEYLQFSKHDNQPARASKSEENLTKNRYRNIVAYDHSRVAIKPSQYTHHSDYINANYIEAYGSLNFIASQGPVPDSFCGFWQMIWEQNCPVIAMVTNEVEGGRLKCHRYWPSDEAGEETYGNIRVVLGPEKNKTHWIMRRFMLHNLETKEEREVVHFLYTAWPDHGVPNSPDELLSFRKAVNKHVKDGDMLCIHCSAGVGRTGTYIAVDSLIRAIEDGKEEIDPYDAVMTMRKCRNYMVQTLSQYQFVFDALLEAVERRLKKAYRALKESEQGISDMEKQVEELEQLKQELAEAQEDFAGFAGVNDEVEEELRKHLEGEKKEAKEAHAKHEYSVDDKDIASRVPRDVRLDSLMTSLESDKWRENVGDLEQKGYRTQTNSVQARIESLAESAREDKWREKYTEADDDWKKIQATGGEDYDTGMQLSAIESRKQSLEQQAQAWDRKSDAVRQELRDDVLSRLTTFEQRLESLNDLTSNSDKRWKARGDGMRGKPAEPSGPTRIGSLSERLEALKDQRDAWKDRGHGFRGEVKYSDPSPPKSSIPETTEEADQVVPESSETKSAQKPEEEVDRTPVNASGPGGGEVDNAPTNAFFKLKKVEKESSSHPMINAANKGKNKKLAKKMSTPSIHK